MVLAHHRFINSNRSVGIEGNQPRAHITTHRYGINAGNNTAKLKSLLKQ